MCNISLAQCAKSVGVVIGNAHCHRSAFQGVLKDIRMQHCNQSEVARIKAEFEIQNAAAHYALYGLSQGIPKHSFITSKMERMGMLHEELKEKIGEEEAIKFIVKVMNKDNKQYEQQTSLNTTMADQRIQRGL